MRIYYKKSKRTKNMGLPSFILGIVLGITITLAFILIYIINTFGIEFIPILISLLDGNISYGDIMSLARYFGYM